jgi:hypothetical protein
MSNQSEIKMPESVIQQINLSYNTEQDRLLLRVGLADDTELLVWLTYRITKALRQLLNGETHMPTATSIQIQTPPQQAVAKFKQEAETVETLQKMDFVTAYQPRKEVVQNAAMLATSVMLVEVTDKPPVLEMPCVEGVNVRINLTPELILALTNMLQLSSKEAAWDIGAHVKTDMQITVLPDAAVKNTLH